MMTGILSLLLVRSLTIRGTKIEKLPKISKSVDGLRIERQHNSLWYDVCNI